MSTRIHLYSGLHTYTANREIVEVSGLTIGECLKNLVERFPALKRFLFDTEGKLLPTVMVSLNLKSQRREELNQTVNPGDEIYLILIIPGG